MKAIGFVMFMFGACGMDSDIRVIPMMMVAVGMVMLFAGQKVRN